MLSPVKLPPICLNAISADLKNNDMRPVILLLLFIVSSLSQISAQFTVQLVVDDDAKQLFVQIKNTAANIPTTAHRISSINMRLTGSGVGEITGVSSAYTLLMPDGSGIITMNSTSLPSPESWIEDQYVTVATYALNPSGSYSSSDFAVQPDLDGDNSDVFDPIMSVQLAGFFNISLGVESTILPVELMYFHAAMVANKDALLRWATATESNNDGFEVQRSSDGLRFEKIGWVNGSSAAQHLRQYQYLDRDLPAGLYYYRLRQVDLDGGFEFSEIRSLHAAGDASAWRLYPNPVADLLYFSGPISSQGISLSIFDASGRLLARRILVEDHLDLSDLPAGVYYIRIDDVKQGNLFKIVRMR